MAIYQVGSCTGWMEMRMTLNLDWQDGGSGSEADHYVVGLAGAKPPVWRDARRGLLLARVAEEPTVDRCTLTRWRSCVGSLNRWRPDRSAALEYVDDDHRRTTVPANKGWRHCHIGYDVGTGFDTGRHDAQQLAYLREIGAPRRIRQQTVVADAMEATR
jgi:hypothetical protein